MTNTASPAKYTAEELDGFREEARRKVDCNGDISGYPHSELMGCVVCAAMREEYANG
jgi:hypothetical protein